MTRAEELVFRLAQAFNFAGLLVLAGAWVFLMLVWRAARVDPSPRPAEVEHAFAGRWRAVVVGAWATAAGASLVAFILTPAWTSPSLPELALLLVGAGAWRVAFRPHPSAGSARIPARVPFPAIALGTVLLLALLITPALGGHAVRRSPAALNLLAALIHMVAAAAWVGGLAMLVAVAFPSVRGLEPSDRARVMAPVVSRFSDVAVVAVGVVVATGVYSSWIQLRSLGEVTTTTYGVVFLLKMAAFVPLLGLGAVNNRWTKPMLQRTSRGDGSPARPLRLVRRLVAVEVALVAVVLALTSFLVRLDPPGLT